MNFRGHGLFIIEPVKIRLFEGQEMAFFQYGRMGARSPRFFPKNPAAGLVSVILRKMAHPPAKPVKTAYFALIWRFLKTTPPIEAMASFVEHTPGIVTQKNLEIIRGDKLLLGLVCDPGCTFQEFAPLHSAKTAAFMYQ